jgi:polar amino acid transport system substrate-binding protein
MRQLIACALLLGSLAGIEVATAADEAVLQQLAPTRTLRVGVAFAPAASALFVTRDAAGQPHGVTVDLGTGLAQELGVAVAFILAPNTGDLTEATSTGAADVSFMPVDEERKKKVDFGPSYYLIESTCLVPGSSDIRTLADVDRSGVRVVGVANTTTVRSAARSLKAATIVTATSVDEAIAMLETGRADAIGLSRDALRPLLPRLPGARVLEGSFQTTGIAVAVPKNRPAALSFVSTFITKAKATGAVRRAFDKVGLTGEPVAP